ncbi:unnamed protein product [Cylindrotheca closterium]|uniref:Uncharacterized protein n=1 Tax=Cylindrotheca closterium TaxID=2856 RepID=A0AAD2CC62_9STRA|nr:unnamed protein product [Cylindrotheca closterium]
MPPSDDKAKYCYEDPDTWSYLADRKLKNADLLIKIPRRSSIKQNGAPRRVSISRGVEIQINLPGKGDPITRRRSIEFSETNSIEEYKSCEDPFDNIWFNKDEYDDIRSSNRKIVKCVERGTDKNFCVRGLESMMDDVQQVRRRNSIDAVLTEQEAQRDSGVYDEEKLSESYRRTSMASQAQAAGRAETDTADIQLYLQSALMLLRRMSV